MSDVVYSGIYAFLQVARELYFSDIQALGMEHIPEHGPIIFAANHPNSIMDTVLMGTQTHHKIHYLARSGLFSNPLVSAFFKSAGAIPLYRPQDGTDTSQNASAFEAAFEALEHKKVLGIFPEGQNSHQRKLLKLKTGTARIALGAEARNGFGLGVKIVPVGMNFLERDAFLSSVLIRFHEPIDVRQWKDAWEQDDREAVRDLTSCIEASLKDAATHIEDDISRELSQDIIQIAGRELMEHMVDSHEGVQEVFKTVEPQRPTSARESVMAHVRSIPKGLDHLDERFKFQRYIADIADWARDEQPRLLRQVVLEVKRYKDHLDQVSLRYDFNERDPSTLSSRKDALRLSFYAIAFGPFAAWGFVHNALPYWITRHIARQASDEAKKAFTALCASIVLFPLWYTLMGLGLRYGFGAGALFVGLYLLSLIPAGFFFLRYRHVVATFRQRVMLRTIFRTERNLLKALESERARIIDLCAKAVALHEASLETRALEGHEPP